MTLLEALGAYLEVLGIGVQCTDLFFNNQPSEPNNCITIIDTGGYPSDETGMIRYPTFQILVRNENYVDAKMKSENIYTALHQQENFMIGEFYIYLAEFEDEPTPMGEDSKGRTEITMNLRFERRS